jgi:adenosylhomocysteine nucleosidase
MLIGIVVAMPEEARAIARCASSPAQETIANRPCHRFTLNGNQIVLMQGGMGFDNAAHAAEALIAAFTPDILISAGFCGAVAAELQVGDCAVACGLAIIENKTVAPVPIDLARHSRELAQRLADKGKRSSQSLFVSTPTTMNKNAIAALLPEKAPLPVVEMESGAIALIAAGQKIPFMAVRTVSDPRHEELQFTLEEFCNKQLAISIPKVLWTIARRPAIIPQLLRLARYSTIAADSLAVAIGTLLTDDRILAGVRQRTTP